MSVLRAVLEEKAARGRPTDSHSEVMAMMILDEAVDVVCEAVRALRRPRDGRAGHDGVDRAQRTDRDGRRSGARRVVGHVVESLWWQW